MGRLKRINGTNTIIDMGTVNASFLQYAQDLKQLGVKNWYFCLEIKDIELIKINPHAVDPRTGLPALTKDQVSRVITECFRNPWYFLREVCRIPDPGNPKGIMYKANRGNMAMTYLFLHGVDSWLNLPRRRNCCLVTV